MRYNKTMGRRRAVNFLCKTEHWAKMKDFCEKEEISVSMFLDDMLTRFFMDNREWLAYKYREAATQADFYRSRIARINIKEQEKEMMGHDTL